MRIVQRVIALAGLAVVAWIGVTSWGAIVHGHPLYGVLLVLTVAGCVWAGWRSFRDRPARHLLHRNKNRPFFTEIVRRGIEQGIFREIDPNAVVQTLVFLMQGLILGSRQEGNSAELVPRAEQAVDLILHGLLKD